MKNIKVLDVTLRDGGCVNNFNFGKFYMNKILNALEDSTIDYIELGYLDSKNGSEDERTQFINEKCIYHNFLINKKEKIKYLVMIDYGKFDIDNLEPCHKNGIDGIRFCFHKKDRFNAIPLIKRIIELGYDCFIQPMLTLRYTDEELIEFINIVNTELFNCSGIYIVDSFGEMREPELKRLFKLFDDNLNKNITLGFHSHNNLQLSYSNAINFINYPTSRNIMVDSSIMGMGKGAGNLNTELLLEHLNLNTSSNYKIEPLLKVIDTVIKPLHAEYHWGYSIEFYLSSINHCTPSYASHYYNKHMLPINKINSILSLIEEEKKISFDKEYAERIYQIYNENNQYDDSKTLESLSKKINGKKVLIIAPGKSINSYTYEIISSSKDAVVISLNFEVPFIKSDYILTTREDAFISLNKNGNKLIVASNILDNEKNNCYIINYKKWIEKQDDMIFDSSAVFSIKLASYLKAKSIILAGLDGFSTNINDNYYSSSLRRGLNEREVSKRNIFYKDFIKKISKEVDIKFITPSLYE